MARKAQKDVMKARKRIARELERVSPILPERVVITLPVSPSANRQWRNGKGRTYKSEEARAYGPSVKKAWKDAGLPVVAFPKGVEVTYTLVWYRFPAAGDLSNRLKACEDSLNGLAWADDKQVVEFHASRVDCKRGEQRIEITIERAVK